MANTNSTPIVDITQIMKVYSGIKGRCGCGCSGKYSYASAHRDVAGKDRGYAVSDDEVSDRSVKMIVNKIEKIFATDEGMNSADIGRNYICVESGNRCYVAYYIEQEQ